VTRRSTYDLEMAEAKQAFDLPGGTVTFLLTDVEGSTKLWEAHARAMEQALACHDRIVAESVAAHRGRLLKHKGEGDSTFVVFARASDAAAAALACQRAFTSEAWPDGAELRVRIAIHTGEAELRDGDYFGPTVNRTARLRGTAHGGQIVMSQATADLVRDCLPDGAALNDLGTHRLPDLGRPETVFGLAHPDLASKFPPLRSLDAFPGNLPVQLTSFVGRERELKLVADRLNSARLVILTGAGGVGKTRLALHAAADMLEGYPDGAWLCELAAVADPVSMLQVVAVSLGLAPGSGVVLADDIAEFIGTRRPLIVLDNCEHLLDAAASLIEAVVARCPSARILATSREALGVPGEQVIRLRSLALPGVDAALDELARVEATRLFVERATAVGSQLEASDASAIVEICRRLDGIPLAIELAAARVVALSPSEIAGLLDERFRLLTGGRRASVERHHTLRAAIDWSYSLLGPTERLVFDRLGVFPATFDAAAAQAVAGEAIETWDVIDALSSLVDKSMLVADRTPSGSTRYQMLETMRQYARERLDAAGTADACRRRHAQHYGDFARKARKGTRSEDDLLWWSRMRTEIDNLRAAVLWALDSRVDEDGDVALRIIADLTAGSFEEWLGVFSWAEQAVERAERAAPALRSAVLGAASMSAWYRADYVRAHRLARDALRDAIPAGSLSPELPFMALMLSSRPDQIKSVLDDGVAALDAVGADALSRFRLHSAAAGSAAQTGDLEFAAAEANETLRIGRQLSHRFVIMVGLYLVALTSWRTAPDEALAALEENIALGESFSANWRGRALALAAQLRAGKGDADGAISAVRQAITQCHRSGERTGVATAFDRGIQVLASTGHREMAAVLGGIVTEGIFAKTHGIPVHELPDRQRTLEHLETELGAQRFTAAIARGAAMTYDEALDSTTRALDMLLQQHGQPP
jgi:predicted ATPase/class 3 adenylate cyclase